MQVVVIRCAIDGNYYLRSYVPGKTELFTLEGDKIEFSIKDVPQKLSRADKISLILLVRKRAEQKKIGGIIDHGGMLIMSE